MNTATSLMKTFDDFVASLPTAPTGIVIDSRRVKPGDLFVALKGVHVNGRDYAAQAIERGAIGVIEDASEAPLTLSVPTLTLPELGIALGTVADAVYRQPTRQLTVIGVTGTNGKTSSACWVADALRLLGKSCGVIGTMGIGLNAPLTPSNNTTPDAASVHETLRDFVTQGAQFAAMEVSSIGLEEHRLNGVRFDTALFTNVTRDHLDYHGTMDAYIAAKEKLFAWSGLKHAVINVNDEVGARLVAVAQNNHVNVLTTSANDAQPADITARRIVSDEHGLTFDVTTPQGQATIKNPNLTGWFNVQNLLGVLGVLLVQQVPLTDAAAVLGQLRAPKGRMQKLGNRRTPRVVVDYAHTPDALRRVCETLKTTLKPGQRLIGVFGCGGNRDAGKRPMMGKVASDFMDVVWLTNDNPRDEDPKAIIAQIKAGIADGVNVNVETNREIAIHEALKTANPGDVVLVAGKGHEDYQEVSGDKHHFDDAEVAQSAVEIWDKKHGMMWRLAEIAADIGGHLNGADDTVYRVVTDSRQVEANDLFIALKGERFDAHDFVADVLRRGAFALIDKAQESKFANEKVIAVDNVTEAFGKLAQTWRLKCNSQVAVVIGSNGKTTVKEMMATILKTVLGDDSVHATRGNLNNAIGLPLTLTQLRARHRVAVIELGMNHRGETLTLTQIAKPDLVVINNAQREHQEFMRDVATVAREHSDALAATRANAVCVLNGNDDYFSVWQQRAEQRDVSITTFGTVLPLARGIVGSWKDNDKGSALNVSLTLSPSLSQEHASLQLPVFGDAMAMNALCALMATVELGVPLTLAAKALEQFKAVAGRLCRRVLPDGVVLIDDTYNANPDSVRAAIRVLCLQPGKERWLVLGDMGEVGEQGEVFHEEVGAVAKEAGVSKLFCVGALTQASVKAFGEGARHYENKDALSSGLNDAMKTTKPDAILIKGSRFMAMEDVLPQITRAIEKK
jgi:murE/murF fusion protein